MKTENTNLSLEELRRAFEAGEQLANQRWDESEYWGKYPREGHQPLPYSNFEEWLLQNYTKPEPQPAQPRP